MRKITKEVAAAFMSREPINKDNTTVERFAELHTNGKFFTDAVCMFLHGNLIAISGKVGKDQVRTFYVSSGGYKGRNGATGSATTKERLNGLQNVFISQKKGQWYLNGKKWDGELIKV